MAPPQPKILHTEGKALHMPTILMIQTNEGAERFEGREEIPPDRPEERT
jgi:hypothetical protein